jgi:uncharacterized integral membrane protein
VIPISKKRYSRAFLVFLVSILFLIFIVPSSLSSTTPSLCIFPEGIVCTDYTFNRANDSTGFLLRNDIGSDIDILSLKVQNCETIDSGKIGKGEEAIFIVNNCNFYNGNFKRKVNITYTNQNTGATYLSEGYVGKVIETESSFPFSYIIAPIVILITIAILIIIYRHLKKK